ncbi:MAG TPA: hypothetical protein VE988_03885 [Gemmataceae bacterium]|nr:hypothetical protein [Gemmataceae bacterium]
MVMITPAVLVCGCTKHTDQTDEQISIAREDAECIVVIAIDLSGSFADLMTRDGKAYDFTCRVLDKYFRNSVGTNNRVIIAQLSATNRALLFDGTPMQLRQRFPTAAEFREFLLSKSDPRGSRIHDGIVDAIEYALSDASVASGKTRMALFALSDFDDNAFEPQQSQRRLADQLKALGRANCVVGFYFLEHFRVPAWRQAFRESGVRHWVCESEIVAYPTLPSFD